MKVRKSLLVAAFASALGAASLMAPYAVAFAPGGFVFFPGAKTHVEITEDALQTIYTELGIPKVSKSMKEARRQITDANKEVDQDQFSSAKHFDGENFTAGASRVKNLLDQAVTQIKANDAAGARNSVGSALHSVQDFYAHSNWVESGRGGPSGELGRGSSISGVSPPGEATCLEAPEFEPCFKGNLITPNLTSGYYGGEDRLKPPGKCRHGGFFDNAPGRGGISKDSGTCLGQQNFGILDAPHNDNNPAATAVAMLATEQVFRDLKSRMTDREFKLLLGIGPSLGFAIDTTGSMGSVIAGVRASAVGIVNARLGTEQEPSKYVLSPFSDPSVGPTTVTPNPDLFKSQINSLFASGGGDCPELAMRGAFNAVDASDEGGDVFLYTDASAKDASLLGSVLSLSSSKKVRLFFALFGSCSPYDPAYFSLANSSGGQVFILNRAEAGVVTQLADMLSRNDAVDIEAAQNVLAGSSASHSFVVDSRLSKLTVSFSKVAATGFVLRRPDGSVVASGQPGVSVIALSNATVFSIATPATGSWRADVSGSVGGEYSLLISGESDLSFDEFRFVELGGRPGHQGYYPIPGLPRLGSVIKGLAKLTGTPSSTLFEFRAMDGRQLQRFALADPGGEAGRLLGDVTVPNENFRIYAVGTDSGGTAFQRLISTVVFPQSVVVSAPASVDLGQNQSTTFIFEVKHSGATDTYNFVGTDVRGYINSVSPASATLQDGGSQLVRVTLNPGSAPVGTSDTITLTATSTSNSSRRNFAVINTSVVAPKLFGDVNRDGVVDCADLALIKASFGSKTGSRRFNPDVDVDTNGVIDIRDLAAVSRVLPAGTVCR